MLPCECVWASAGPAARPSAPRDACAQLSSSDTWVGKEHFRHAALGDDGVSAAPTSSVMSKVSHELVDRIPAKP